MSEIDEPEKIKRRTTLDNLKARQELADMGFVMSSPEGRRFMNYLLSLCGIMKLSYSGPGRSEETAFYEGQRNIGNNLFRTITKNFKKEWLIMMDEAEKQEAKNG